MKHEQKSWCMEKLAFLLAAVYTRSRGTFSPWMFLIFKCIAQEPNNWPGPISYLLTTDLTSSTETISLLRILKLLNFLSEEHTLQKYSPKSRTIKLYIYFLCKPFLLWFCNVFSKLWLSAQLLFHILVAILSFP